MKVQRSVTVPPQQLQKKPGLLLRALGEITGLSLRLDLMDQLEGLARPQGQDLEMDTLLASYVALLSTAADLQAVLDLLDALWLLENHASVHEVSLSEHRRHMERLHNLSLVNWQQIVARALYLLRWGQEAFLGSFVV